METYKDTEWRAVPTELDELWCPLLEFVGGGAEGAVSIMVAGGAKPSAPTFEGERFYLLKFHEVEMVCGYSESMYCILAEKQPGTGSLISEITNSRKLAKIRDFRSRGLRHLTIVSGGMHCEIIANPDYELCRFDSEEAVQASAREFVHLKTKNHDASVEGFDILDIVNGARLGGARD